MCVCVYASSTFSVQTSLSEQFAVFVGVRLTFSHYPPSEVQASCATSVKVFQIKFLIALLQQETASTLYGVHIVWIVVVAHPLSYRLATALLLKRQNCILDLFGRPWIQADVFHSAPPADICRIADSRGRV